MQTACYQVLFCVIQGFGMVFSNPQDFEVLAAISVGALALAAIVYTAYFLKHAKPGVPENNEEEEEGKQGNEGEEGEEGGGKEAGAGATDGV